MARSLVEPRNCLLEGNDTNSNVLIERIQSPNLPIHSLVAGVATKDWSNDMQNEKYNTRRDMYLC